MIRKKLVTFLLLGLYGPGHFYRVLSETEQCKSDYCQNGPNIPILESRLFDQKPYSHPYKDESSENKEHTVSDNSEKSSSTTSSKEKNISIGDDINGFEKITTPSSEVMILCSNTSEKLCDRSPVTMVTPEFLPDVLASLNGSVNSTANSESAIDSPVTVAALAEGIEDIINMEILEVNTPKVNVETVASKPNSDIKSQIEDITDFVKQEETATADLLTTDGNKEPNSIKKMGKKHRGSKPSEKKAKEIENNEQDTKDDKTHNSKTEK